MSLETRLIALAQALGADVKDIYAKQGNLASLSTTAKTDIVTAINELAGLISGGGGAPIDDNAGNGDTTVTWSADKSYDSIQSAINGLKDELLGGAGAAFDTLEELATALGEDPNFATTITTALGLRVRVDEAQSFDNTQKTQGRDNIGAASAADLNTLTTNIGDTDYDFVAAYTTAKA